MQTWRKSATRRPQTGRPTDGVVPRRPRDLPPGAALTRGGRRRDRRQPERRCAVTRQSAPRAGLLVRFVPGPEGEVVADLAERLPGRGMWVGAERGLVTTARQRRLFGRALRCPELRVAADLEDRIEAALASRLMDGLRLARKTGGLVAGYEKTRARLGRGPVGALVEAADGAGDGCRRLRRLQPSAPRIGCLTADELGAVFGRGRTVHAALDPGGLVPGLLRDAGRLEGFRAAPTPAGDTARESGRATAQRPEVDYPS